MIFDKEIMRRDFAAFADTATKVAIDANYVYWQQDGEKRCAEYEERQGHEFPKIIFSDRKYEYREFFASPHMANLRDTAEKALRMWASNDSQTKIFKYLDGPASSSDINEGNTRVQQLIESKVGIDRKQQTDGETQVIFIHGAAGAGKTAALRHISKRTAEKFLSAESTRLYLYFDAQGESLAKLDDLFARTLQDIRTRFTYHALPTLTRLGLIVPIVDGFDELLGYGGVREAFSSLRLFLSRLDGAGEVVTSARSTFYEYSELQYIGLGNHDYIVTTIEILPWDKVTIGRFLQENNLADPKANHDPETEAEYFIEKCGFESDQIIGNPFFISRIAQLIKENSENLTSSTQTELARELIRRETSKLAQNGSSILTDKQHYEFAKALAEEMWNQERADLDTETIKTIAHLLCEENFDLAGDSARAFIERSISHALLRPSANKKLAFQHEFYYAHFLGLYIAEQLIKSDRDCENTLGRSHFSDTVGDAAALEIGDANIPAVIERLNRVQYSRISASIGRANNARVVTGIIKSGSSLIRNLCFSNGDFYGSNFSNTRLEGFKFIRCKIEDANFSGANWSDVDFSEAHIVRMRIDNKTKLNQCKFLVGRGLLGISNSKDDFTYDQAETLKIIRFVGGLSKNQVEDDNRPLSKEASRAKECLKKILKMARRTYRFSENDLENRNINNSDWLIVRVLLEKYGFLETKTVQRRGSSGELMHLTIHADTLEQGESLVPSDTIRSQVISFWEDLKSL